MTEYINLERSGNDKGDDQKGNICMPPLGYCYNCRHYKSYNYCHHTSQFTILRGN